MPPRAARSGTAKLQAHFLHQNGQHGTTADIPLELVFLVAAAVEEQSVTTRDIAENVGQASTGITEINANVATSSSMTRAISSDIENVRTASDEMTTSSKTVQESATELSELAERLREQVSRFKI